MNITALDQAIKAAYPGALGVSIGNRDDKSTWRPLLPASASAAERATATTACAPVIAAFDASAPEPALRDLAAELTAMAERNAKLEAALAAKNVVSKEEIDAVTVRK